jgi:Xaa-Pro aminopeptidase
MKLEGLPTARALDRVTEWLAASDFDLLVLTGADWVFWVTGYARYGAGMSTVLVGNGRPARLLLPAYEICAASECVDLARVELVGYTDEGFGLLQDPLPPLRNALGLEAIGKARVAQVGSNWLDDDGLLNVRSSDVSAEIGALRMVKSPLEVSEIARRVELCWVAQRAIADALEGDVDEIELFSLARSSAERFWGSPIEMVADVVGGSMCQGVGAPVSVPGHRRLESGDALVADLALGASGYSADITWTHVTGRNDHVQHIRDGLLGVLDAVALHATPGRRCSDLYREMAELIHEIEARSSFSHHGGHGIGLSVYEPPFIAPFDATELQVGMVLALEPGAYGEGWGVRVENNFVVTDQGAIEIPGRPLEFRRSGGA